jgi:hypothetical protein
MKSEFEMICYLAAFESDKRRRAEAHAMSPFADTAEMLFRHGSALRIAIRRIALGERPMAR